MKNIFLFSVLFLCLTGSYAQQQNSVILTVTTENIVPFIDKLQNGEHFTIHYGSTGCFHNQKETMTFQRENDTYFVVLNNEKKTLNDDFIEQIRKFEKELAQQSDIGCTTVDKYLVTYKDTHRVIMDGSCAWNGYGKLKKLFGFTV